MFGWPRRRQRPWSRGNSILSCRLFAIAFQVLIQVSFRGCESSSSMSRRIGAAKCFCREHRFLANQSRLQRVLETLVRHLSSQLRSFQRTTALRHPCTVIHSPQPEKRTEWYIMISELDPRLLDNHSRCLEQLLPESFSRHEHFRGGEGTSAGSR